jgi:RNA polymerase sigma factor for flagellar operon FliA
MTHPRAEHDCSRLIEEHLDLVNHVVLQVAVNYPRHVDRDELAHAGALGLVEAAGRYDASRGVPFDRFAAQRIRGAVIDAVRAADWAPRSVRMLARRLEQAEQQLAVQLGRTPEMAETAAAMGMRPEDVRGLRARVFRSVVLAIEHVVDDAGDEELTLLDVLAGTDCEPAAELERRELHAYLRDAVALLPDRHRRTVVGYFLAGQTSEEIADTLGVTVSRVSQVRKEALAMLREGIEAQYASRDAPGAVGVQAGGTRQRRRADYARSIGTASRWDDRISSRRHRPGDEGAAGDLAELTAAS